MIPVIRIPAQCAPSSKNATAVPVSHTWKNGSTPASEAIHVTCTVWETACRLFLQIDVLFNEERTKCVLNLVSMGHQVCYECVQDAMDSASTQSCSGFLGSFCPGFTQCQEVCAGCLSDIQEWYDCTLEDNLPGCDISCDLPAFSPPPVEEKCAVENAALNECGATFSTFDWGACIDCANDASNAASTASCDSYVQDFCPIFLNCAQACGDCHTLAEETLNCIVGGNSCNVDCLRDGNPLQESTESPTASPADSVSTCDQAAYQDWFQ